MNKKYPWLPVDERLIPDIFSFTYPKDPWVRIMLAVEMVLAVAAVIGTLILALLPSTIPVQSESSAASTYTNTTK
ncbi:hypothetical protein HY408_00370 [Candidatus Gottesmanbacteria bacterium]|nr:hypothetical protein [Candidatus Gottesmanbacteria bacterium]